MKVCHVSIARSSSEYQSFAKPPGSFYQGFSM